MQRKWQHSSTSGMLCSWGYEGEKKPRLKNTKDRCLCSREHTEYRSLTNRSIVWHSFQFLHNINVQQLKGQQILQEKTHMSKLWNWIISVLGSTDPTDVQITLGSSTQPQGAVFPQHIFTPLNMLHKMKAARGKAKNSLVRARERLNADSFWRILICPTYTFHIMTVPNTSLRKQFCYVKCNILFLKIEWPFFELRRFILTNVYLPRHQTQGDFLYIYLNFSTLPVQWGDRQMGYKILSHLADFSSLKE